jgi:hypothetical protein
VAEAGGQFMNEAQLPEIDYHGALVDLPAGVVRTTVDALNAGSDTQLLRLTDVKYFSPMGQASISVLDDGEEVPPKNRPLPSGSPVVAMLDGLPLANHAALQDRLRVDDPDDLAADYGVGEHRHGTAMASLIAHGEYDGNEAALPTPIYVRPVMVPGAPDIHGRRLETFPKDEMPVDLVHRAVRRMFEADGATPAQAPGVKAINLSLGDRAQPFDRQVSPWARLLDWLAWKYQVLFIVSTGNHADNITIPVPQAAVAGLSDDELRAHTLRAMAQQRLQRRLLAPSEAINALTVGALHAQSAPDGYVGTYVDLLRGAALPSPIGTVASGFRRSIKPEILVPGGRRHYAPAIGFGGPTSAVFRVTDVAFQPGQLVAACDPSGTSNQHAARASGSSNATALTTRRAALLMERVAELQAEPGGTALADPKLAVVLKAMLVHGATWGNSAELFDAAFDSPDSGTERWRRIKRVCGQFLGYGVADFDRGAFCTDERVVLLGTGELLAEQGHVYRVPLPPALHAQRVKRRLTITLAWFTPVNPRHRSYRVADLWFDPPVVQLDLKRHDADHQAVTRGTVQHEVLEGEKAVSIVDGDTMPVQVNCRPEAASKLGSPIPYALMVSLETAQPLGVSIYSQVKTKIDALHVPVAVRAAVGPRARSR